MRNPVGIVFLVLFVLTTLFTYVAVRQRQLSFVKGVAFSALSASVCFILFIGSQNGNWLQALIFGTLIGTVFSVLTVSAARYFRANDAARASTAPELRRQSPTDQ
ncbi:MAG: hypothetical protein RML95_07540 [Anaerolineae bacterium]|nr:hypothetical protein [Anaerolineae bacterium]MDW8299177.1 hypothetical protein [Anaerolineae bacterium]